MNYSYTSYTAVRHLAVALLSTWCLLFAGPLIAQAQDNGDVHDHGTVVNGDRIDLGADAETGVALPLGRAKANGTTTAVINGVNTRINLFDLNCLFTFTQVNVTDPNGDAILGLTEADFSILEDAGSGFAPPLDQIVIPPQGATLRKADIVFAVDNSGSMGNEIAAIRNNLSSFVSALQSSGIDAQLGLVRYGQGGGGTFNSRSGSPIITNGGALVADPIVFRDNIFSQNTINGGTEPMYAAIVQGLQSFNFRSDAQTIIIGVTDERFDQGINSEAEALAALQANNATFFGLVPTFSSFLRGQAERLANPTGGSVFNITSNFNTILNTIVDQVAGVYTVGYIPSDSFTSALPRDVEITVNVGATRLTATATYTPGSRPAVRRSAATVDRRRAASGQPLTLQADVVDLLAPGVTTATLFYRTSGSTGSYASIAMSDLDGDGTYDATVPASAMQAPGLDFYFQVSDGTANTTAPSADPQTNPFQVGVGTNSAPRIVHGAPKALTPGTAVPIVARIDDAEGLAGATLFYRQQGRLVFERVAMTGVTASVFTASIPGSEVSALGVEYYLAATDVDGVTRTFGTPDLPVVLGGCIPLENTPPVCALASVNGAAPFVFSATAQDAESGLASVAPLALLNASLAVDPFTPGTNDVVGVTGAQVDASQPVAFALELADQAANTATCAFSGPGLLVAPIFDCESLTPGTIYPVGVSIPSGTLEFDLSVGSFGSFGSGGTCTAVGGGSFSGGGTAILAENATLNVTPSTTASSVSFSIGGYLGGQCVLTVNGVTIEVDDFRNFDGTTIGGVTISVTGDDSEQRVTLTGDVESVEVGGESHLIDDIAVVFPDADPTPPVCGPVTLAPNADGDLEGFFDATDPESGIASVEFTTLINFLGFVDAQTGFVEGDLYTVPGTPETVRIGATQVDPTGGGGLMTLVTNGEGLTSECDPVVQRLSSLVPEQTTLGANFPNPVTGRTTIGLSVAEPGPVKVEVFDLLGRKVSTLIDQQMAPGTYEIGWEASETATLAPGTYVYRLTAGETVITRRMTLVR